MTGVVTIITCQPIAVSNIIGQSGGAGVPVTFGAQSYGRLAPSDASFQSPASHHPSQPQQQQQQPPAAAHATNYKPSSAAPAPVTFTSFLAPGHQQHKKRRILFSQTQVAYLIFTCANICVAYLGFECVYNSILTLICIVFLLYRR